MLPEIQKFEVASPDTYMKNNQLCVKGKSIPGKHMYRESCRLKEQLIQRINQYSAADLTTVKGHMKSPVSSMAMCCASQRIAYILYIRFQLRSVWPICT